MLPIEALRNPERDSGLQGHPEPTPGKKRAREAMERLMADLPKQDCSCGHHAVSSNAYYSRVQSPDLPGLCVECYRTGERDRARARREERLHSTSRLNRAGHESRPRLEHTPEVEAALGVLRDAKGKRIGNQGYVYLISEEGRGMVKIGYSTKPSARPGELQTGNGRRLALLASFEGGQDDEHRLHCRYAAQAGVGEWFKPSAGLYAEFDLDARGEPRTAYTTAREIA